ncbi:TIGR03087 family PEP-CTERM/XrtA system glycosyltransferase [Acidihalobacter aeolianus]|uniref:TIGR03087 family PEP-CTERM/XrtA system glycosyltransferase n=1 Tax=Acidihalobacter aeolianus TaxID=2792603 RepID=UPI000B28532F|nr:TIGR03087 family PEP-CTERM/XrtA system glycosyltransferase [Acidihalobacter aeolianus]
MREILFLAHRIPYPPDKGDKIRSYNILKGLAQQYRVHLGAFIDDPDDMKHGDHLRSLCASVYLPRLLPLVGQIRGLPSTVAGAPLSVARYRHTRFSNWVTTTMNTHPINAVYAFSAAIGTYALLPAPYPMRRIMDFVDVDSEKWRQYATSSRFPMNMIYRREYKTLAHVERQLAEAFDTSIFVTEEEAALFRNANPNLSQRVCAIGNGIDLNYFDASVPQPNPYPDEDPRIVFTGAMDYQANIDGVVWFCQNVWPLIRAVVSRAQFYIVGQRPSPAVKRLELIPGVVVTGRVPDVRPYLAHANVVCAPLRVGRGIQNKVLEALAMGRPVVGTGSAWEGLGRCEAYLGERVDEPEAFAKAVLQRLSGPHEDVSLRRNWLITRFSWDHSVNELIKLLTVPQDIQDANATPKFSRGLSG